MSTDEHTTATHPHRRVAAFDLDGTLIDGHSMALFTARLAWWPRLVWEAAAGIPRCGLPPSRARYKQAVLRGLLAGRPEHHIRQVGVELAGELERRINSTMLEILESHRRAGDELVLVTSALDVYAEPFAERLGFTGVIATRVEIRDGTCTGRLVDADLNDERKVERLKAWLGSREPDAIVTAYGDSEDDDEMIAFAAATHQRNSTPTHRG